jgi:predicted aldo/keto reductase-like oxidoreductase
MTKEEIQKFSILIETLALEKGIPYIDAVVYYCEKNDFEVEVAAKLISGPLKSKIKLEAQNLNFIPKSRTKRLPL